MTGTDAHFEMRLAEKHEFEEAYLQLITRTRDLFKISVISGLTISIGVYPTQSLFIIVANTSVKYLTYIYRNSVVLARRVPDSVTHSDSQCMKIRTLRTRKLIGVRSCLVSKVTEKIELLETIAANYSVVWNILKKRYDDLASRIKGCFQHVQNPASYAIMYKHQNLFE